jgi:hypothetical protein
MTPATLSARALNRATLDRQMLLDRTRKKVPAALEHLVGMQAQAPDATRTTGNFPTSPALRGPTRRHPRRPGSCPSTTTCCSRTPTAAASSPANGPSRCRLATAPPQGTLLVDGLFAGTWRASRRNGQADLQVTTFAKLPKPDASAVIREGLDLLTFIAPEGKPDVVVRPGKH